MFSACLGAQYASTAPDAAPRVALAAGEPRQRDYDGGVRRKAVLDTDHRPPRVVRRVGWHSCLRCSRPFFSQDVAGQRLCGDCRVDGDRYV